MSIRKDEASASRDVYLDYDFEAVACHWNHRTASAYVRFYGTAEYPELVVYHNRLFNGALCFGWEISHEEYEHGFPLR